MKLTTKQILFLLMCTLLILVIVMGTIVINRISGLFSRVDGSTPSTPAAEPSSSSQTQESSQIPSSSSQATIPTETHTHDLKKDQTISATCDSSGYTLYSCSCGKTDIRDFKDPLGHNYGPYTVVPATCEADGYTERVCSRCKKAEHTKPTTGGHKFNQWQDIPVSDGTPTQEQRTCNACQVTEIRSKNPASTWLLRKHTLEKEGRFDHYQIILADTETSYDIYTDLVDKNMGFDYSTSGLTITYKIGNADKAHTAPAAGKNVLTIYVSGKVTNTTPEDDEPGTSTGPNGSTGTSGNTGTTGSTGTTSSTTATTTTTASQATTTSTSATTASSSAAAQTE